MGIGVGCVDTEVHCGDYVDIEKVEAVQIGGPSEDAQAGEDENPEGQWEGENYRDLGGHVGYCGNVLGRRGIERVRVGAYLAPLGIL